MNIIVCLKQVPSPENPLHISPNGQALFPDGNKWIINPFDEYGIEAALRLKESIGGKLTVISLGPRRVGNALRKALAMGADEGVMILSEYIAPWDSMSIARLLYQSIQSIEFDLIFTGQRGIDCEMGAVGAYLANYLELPFLSNTIDIEILNNGSSIRTRNVSDEQILTIESSLPAVIAAERGLNEPRLLTLNGLREAKRKKIVEISLPGSEKNKRTSKINSLILNKIEPVISQRSLQIIDGNTSEEMAAKLFRILRFKENII